MARLLGDEYQPFLSSYDEPARQGLRVNTLKLDADRWLSISPFSLRELPWPDHAWLVSDEVRPGKHPYHAAGLYYLQDPSAMAPALLLDPQPGDRVLDLAAAPGGKATHIASMLSGRGILVANEIHPTRALALAENLERWGAQNAVITVESPERLADRWPEFFDRVLLDAPCSGEGMFRKGDTARSEWSPALVHGCAVRQSAILEQAAQLLRPGGRLVYSTCTFAPEEDEAVVGRFLSAHPEFEILEPLGLSLAAPGRPEWVQPEDRHDEVRRSVRIWPHLSPGDGHFAAVLRKMDSAAQRRASSPRRVTAARDAIALFDTFARDNLTAEFDRAAMATVGSRLYRIPEGAPDLAGLRFLHPGWWLGTIRTNWFEPSHALALGIRADDAAEVQPFHVESPAVESYLRGETLSSPGRDGWVLVTISGFPIGWGKRVADQLKSHYPRGLRRLS
jgi:NOL1/NOP2/sun family putative RNA methylase